MTDVVRKFNAEGMAPPKVPLSHGVLAGGWPQIAGMVARTTDGEIVEDDVTEATIVCLENMLRVVETAGGSKSDITKVNVYLERFEDYGAMNAAFERFFEGSYPARTTIAAGALGIGNVELDGLAYLPNADLG